MDYSVSDKVLKKYRILEYLTTGSEHSETIYCLLEAGRPSRDILEAADSTVLMHTLAKYFNDGRDKGAEFKSAQGNTAKALMMLPAFEDATAGDICALTGLTSSILLKLVKEIKYQPKSYFEILSRVIDGNPELVNETATRIRTKITRNFYGKYFTCSPQNVIEYLKKYKRFKAYRKSGGVDITEYIGRKVLLVSISADCELYMQFIGKLKETDNEEADFEVISNNCSSYFKAGQVRDSYDDPEYYDEIYVDFGIPC